MSKQVEGLCEKLVNAMQAAGPLQAKKLWRGLRKLASQVQDDSVQHLLWEVVVSSKAPR